MTEQDIKKLRKRQLRSLVLELSRKLEVSREELEKQKRLNAKDVNVMKSYHQQELFNKDQEYKEEITYLREALNNREIAIEEAGSIAEAALKIQDIFNAAQEAADLYLENLSELTSQQTELTQKRDAESKERAEKLIMDAQKQSDEFLEATRIQCERMVETARKDAGAYWEDVSRRLEEFYDEHRGLRELLMMPMGEARSEEDEREDDTVSADRNQ